MSYEENIESLITDERVIESIEDKTLSCYKKLFELTEFLKSYFAQIEEIENKLLSNKKNNYNSIEIENQINVIKTHIKDCKLKLNLTFEDLYRFSNENNYFFCYSTLNTYKFYFESFFWNFKKITGENEKLQYFKHEYEYHINFQRNNFLLNNDNRTNFIHRTRFNDHFAYLDIYPYLFETNKLKIKFENEKVLNYLKEKIHEQGFKVKEKNGKISFKNNTQNIHPSDEVDESLTQKDLPNFDNLDRFELLKELKIDNIIHNLDTSQKSKYKVLALIMGTHPDTARKLLTNKYPKLKSKESIANLVLEANKNVKHFLNNPINNIKIP